MPNRREKGKDEQPRERPSLFQKTKMCKFHLVGICTKGSACVFAHNREELNALPDLSRTKLCKTLINTGVWLSCAHAAHTATSPLSSHAIHDTTEFWCSC